MNNSLASLWCGQTHDILGKPGQDTSSRGKTKNFYPRNNSLASLCCGQTHYILGKPRQDTSSMGKTSTYVPGIILWLPYVVGKHMIFGVNQNKIQVAWVRQELLSQE